MPLLLTLAKERRDVCLASFVVTGGCRLSRGPTAVTPDRSAWRWTGDGQGTEFLHSSHPLSTLSLATPRAGVSERRDREVAEALLALDRSPSGFRRPESWGEPFVR